MSENKRDKNKTRLFGAITEKCTYKKNKERYKSLYVNLFNNNENTKWGNLREEIGLIDDEKFYLINGIALTSVRHVFGWGNKDEDVRKNFKEIVDEYNKAKPKGYPEPCIDIIKSIVDFWYEDGLFNEINEKRNIYKLLIYDGLLHCKSHLSAACAYYYTQRESIETFNNYIEQLCSKYPEKYFERKHNLTKLIKELNKEEEYFGKLCNQNNKPKQWRLSSDYLMYF